MEHHRVNDGKQTEWPKVVDLRTDPFERAMEESDMYLRWYIEKMWTFVPAQAVTARFLKTSGRQKTSDDKRRHVLTLDKIAPTSRFALLFRSNRRTN